MVDNLEILSTTEVEIAQAKQWAANKGATQLFIDNACLYWCVSNKRGNVNPALAYVQYGKETGYGKFGGVLDESYCNPCGLKVSAGGSDTDASAHKRFDSWEQGITAHIDHLALYAGDSCYPKFSSDVTYSDGGGEQFKANGETEDPRHFPYLLGSCTNVIDLGGKWAPSETYGTDLLRMYNELLETEFTPEETPEEDENENTDNRFPMEQIKVEISSLKKEISKLKEENKALNDSLISVREDIERFENIILRVKAFADTL